jgi:hypothetical protein
MRTKMIASRIPWISGRLVWRSSSRFCEVTHAKEVTAVTLGVVAQVGGAQRRGRPISDWLHSGGGCAAFGKRWRSPIDPNAVSSVKPVGIVEAAPL